MRYIKQRQAIYDNYVSRGVPELLAACFVFEIDDVSALHGVDDKISFYQDIKDLIYNKKMIPIDDWLGAAGMPLSFWEQFTFYDNTGKVQYDKNNRPTSITIKL